MKRSSLLTSLAVGVGNSGAAMVPKRQIRPTLRGVVFDMDGTLTKPNLDFTEMYRRCSVDLSHDILEQVAAMSPDEQRNANAIIEEMEAEGRRTLELMPAAQELILWLESHEIPMALVTRNTQKSADVLTQRLLNTNTNFAPVIARDAGYPAKPDPTALKAIADKWSISLPSDSILMVGDSLANDIGFGKNAGVQTALLDTGRSYLEKEAGKSGLPSPDFVVDTLLNLPSYLWNEFHLPSRLGNAVQSMPKVPTPDPTTALTKAAASGDAASVHELLSQNTTNKNERDASGNTALIWAVEKNQLSVVEILISHGVDLDHRGFLGATAVSRASRRGRKQVLDLLIGAKASLEVPNDKLQYPLHFAAFQKHFDIVELLLASGANPGVLDRKGRTPADDTSDESTREVLLDAIVKMYAMQ